MNNGKIPTCDKADCFACEDGHCMILTKNDFGARKCPFHKTNEQAAEEKAYCEKRLA